eukprot:7595109-Pyramimonas_sp.AAC.1
MHNVCLLSTVRSHPSIFSIPPSSACHQIKRQIWRWSDFRSIVRYVAEQIVTYDVSLTSCIRQIWHRSDVGRIV